MKKTKPQNRIHLTVAQSVSLAAAAASLAAVSTTLIASHWFHFQTIQGENYGTIVSRTVIASKRNPREWNAWRNADNMLASSAILNDRERHQLPLIPRKKQDLKPTGDRLVSEPMDDDGTTSAPSIAWLMSFPNSGTSFTLHLTREASNCTTATNYALEGEVKDQPGVQAIPTPDGSHGPWLEIIPNRPSRIPRFILTKTHCGGFCSYCPPFKYVETPRSFQMSCQTGTKAYPSKEGELKKKVVTYDSHLVKKAIHVFRHPLDNVVARFHLDHRRQLRGGNSKKSLSWPTTFPRNSTGFQRWCHFMDSTSDLLDLHWVDQRMRDALDGVPCKAEFFRYVQWHNMAFVALDEMGIPSMNLHYEDYQYQFDETRERIIDFLELPRSSGSVEFVPGKEYRDYYNLTQTKAIQGFIKEFSSRATWTELERYTKSMVW
ncbi:expressed unknown protein [Seminavis robusta]|uniref:Sulfotransferase n=1 Tax=Seminavis robusta TaxID=568900 RepID=A0A9N8H9K2_9STRA|nr:expressed unknown protein [Seminavis robusta]|eukprot:Sro120_g058320.1 n/a (433) ;mRNA; r:16693-18079